MKRILSIPCLVLMSIVIGIAQPKPYKVVFDLTSRDTLDQIGCIILSKPVFFPPEL